MFKCIQQIQLSAYKKTIMLFFHDSNKSGATLALLDIIDEWLKTEKHNIICVFPKASGTAIDYLKDKTVMMLSYPYWQSVKKGNESLIVLLKKYVEFIVSYLTTLYVCFRYFKILNVHLIYSNTSVIFEGLWTSKFLQLPHVWHVREFMTKEHMIVPLFGNTKHYSFVSKHADTLILISNALLEHYKEYISQAKKIRIYDDISSRYIFEEKSAWKDCKMNIFFAGNITPGKGQHVAIKALYHLKQRELYPQLYFAGAIEKENNEYYKYLLHLITKYELEEQVRFLGHVEDMNAIRRTMGIGIIASQKEAFGRVTIEGMLAGMLMIGANDSGTSELINDSRNGYLFKFNDDNELAQIIYNVLTSSEMKINEIRDNAMKFGKLFVQGTCAREVEHEIDCLINR